MNGNLFTLLSKYNFFLIVNGMIQSIFFPQYPSCIADITVCQKLRYNILN